MKKEMRVDAMDMGWVKKFAGKLIETCKLLDRVILCADTAMKLVNFCKELASNPGIRVDSQVVWELKAQVLADDPANDYEGAAIHQVIVKGWATAPVIIQMLTPLVAAYFDHLKAIETDSKELQDVLNAVSLFRDRAFSGCTDDLEASEDKPN